MMDSLLRSIREDAEKTLRSVKSATDLESFRVYFLGKKGKLRDAFERFKILSEDDKKRFGPQVNELKSFIESSIAGKKDNFVESSSGGDGLFDSTLPPIMPSRGSFHLITQTIREICSHFVRLGFEVVDGPEIETEFHNFSALNIPLDHPSRDAFDTFYTESGELLRSQTSTVQIRVMEKRKPPLRIVAPGRVYRPDAVDASHSFMFHQIEGLMIDDKTTFSDLKGILLLFLRELFGKDIKIRFRPHYFPFTEPSVEVDIRWKSGWLEILGAGSVHPNVFQRVGYDPKAVQGFAFGLGVERMAMLRHGIQDIRYFYENDLRFLRQF